MINGDGDGMDGFVDIVDRKTARAEEQDKQRFESINRLLFLDGAVQDDDDVEVRLY